MRLSKKCEYAFLAMITLSDNYNIKLSNIDDISKRNGIPRKFLEHILTLLKSGNYIRSVRGPKGGYSLTRPPSKISLAEIVRLVDGPIAPSPSVSTYFYDTSPIERNNKVHAVFKDIRDTVSDKLENIYFSDLI